MKVVKWFGFLKFVDKSEKNKSINYADDVTRPLGRRGCWRGAVRGNLGAFFHRFCFATDQTYTRLLLYAAVCFGYPLPSDCTRVPVRYSTGTRIIPAVSHRQHKGSLAYASELGQTRLPAVHGVGRLRRPTFLKKRSKNRKQDLDLTDREHIEEKVPGLLISLLK